MKSLFLTAGLVVGGLAVALWFGRDSAVVKQATQQAEHAVGSVAGGTDSTPSTAKTLAAAGVHKCQVGANVVYSEKACPKGSRELAANGGAVTVVAMPKAPKPADDEASSVLGGPLVKGFSKAEVERMRDKEIEAAANR